jgi:hypothetical protein
MPKIITNITSLILVIILCVIGIGCSSSTTSVVTPATPGLNITSPVISPQQPFSAPNVKIQAVNLPSNAKISTGTSVTNFDSTLRLVNNESVDETLDWQVESSINGKFDSGSVTVPKNAFKDITKAYHYTIPGSVKMTYTLTYKGTQIDVWSGNLNIGLPDVKIQSVILPPNVKASNMTPVTNYETVLRLVNNESFDVTVDWQVESSINGKFDSGNVTIPKNGTIDVIRSYHYTVTGAVNMTYTIRCGGTVIDSWSGDMKIL